MTTKAIPGGGLIGLARYIQSLLDIRVVSHDYGAAAADWTLSTTEQKASYIVVTNANGACAAIAPVIKGRTYNILNTSGQAFTFKASGQTGITIASTKAAIVVGNAAGTDYIRLTSDA